MPKKRKSPRYSDEHKAEVVKLIRDGVSPSEIKLKGSPVSFARWREEADKRDGIAAPTRAPRARRSTPNERQAAIDQYATGLTAEQVATKLGHSPQTVLRWVAHYAPELRRKLRKSAEADRLNLAHKREMEALVAQHHLERARDQAEIAHLREKLLEADRRPDNDQLVQELARKDDEIIRLRRELEDLCTAAATLEKVKRVLMPA
jgi:transposase-like protein